MQPPTRLKQFNLQDTLAQPESGGPAHAQRNALFLVGAVEMAETNGGASCEGSSMGLLASPGETM